MFQDAILLKPETVVLKHGNTLYKPDKKKPPKHNNDVTG